MTNNKNILLIDTSLSGISIVLHDVTENKIVSEHISFDENSNGKQSVELPITVEKFISKNNLKFSDLSAIGIVVGPGSFTGIRLGIAYAKGLSIGLNIPVIPVNAFEIYLAKSMDAFVAIDSKRGDFFVAAHDIEPCTMTIDDIETKQMEYTKTVGHKPYDLTDALPIIINKLESKKFEPVIPMYLRPSYAELNCKC